MRALPDPFHSGRVACLDPTVEAGPGSDIPTSGVEAATGGTHDITHCGHWPVIFYQNPRDPDFVPIDTTRLSPLIPLDLTLHTHK
jgi:hypothetical protein